MTIGDRASTPHWLCLALSLFVPGCDQSDRSPPAPKEREQTVLEASTPGAQQALKEAVARPSPASEGVAGPERGRPAASPVLPKEEIEAQYTPELKACLNTGDAASGVSLAMGGCVHAELEIQDARLNEVYRTAMARRTPSQKAALRKEQRAWIKRRDSDCQAEATGGTIDLVDVPHCILDETVRRRMTLQTLAG